MFDPELDGSLGLVIPVSVLTEHGVEEMFHLGEDLIQPNSKNIIYIVNSLLSRSDMREVRLCSRAQM